MKSSVVGAQLVLCVLLIFVSDVALAPVDPYKVLSADKVIELKESFRLFDKDGDGAISKDDLRSVLQKFGDQLEDSEINEMFETADKDKDGAIQFSEFLEIIADVEASTDEEEELQEAFRMFDKNNNGYLTGDDLRRVFNNLGDEISDEEIDKMIREADLDGDGAVNLEEFKAIVENQPSDASTGGSKPDA